MIKTNYIQLNKRQWLVAISLTLVLAIMGGTVAWASLAAGGTINGVVTAPGGSPPPNGTVVKLFEAGADTVFGQANVDPVSGAFSIGPVPNGLYVLKAVPPVVSGLTQSVPVPVSVVGGPVHGVYLQVTEPQVTGLVYSPGGAMPVTATVKVFLGSGDVLQSVPAPGGAFAIGGLPAGGYLLRAFPATDDPYWKSELAALAVTPGVTRTKNLTLTRAALWGITRDHLGNPVANAKVHALSVNLPRRYQTDYSSGSGFWAIGGLPDGNYYLAAEPPFNAHELLPTEPITVTIPATATNPHTLTFGSSPKILSGTVTSNLGGSGDMPVENAYVVAHRVDKHGTAHTLTNASGEYQMRLSAGLWAVTVKPISATAPSHWVYPQPPQLVHYQQNTEPEEKTQNFKVIIADSQVTGSVQLPSGGTLTIPDTFTVTVGIFNNEGIGKRAVIQIGEPFTITVPHGGYKVVVYPHHPQYLGPVIEPIRVEPESTYDLGALTLVAKDAVITGTVTDSGGVGVPDIPVTAWRANTPDTLRTRTGPDGGYVLPVAAGRWHVQPAPGPVQPYLYTGSGETVAIESGEVVGNVNFGLLTADATINGYLLDEAGNPISDVEGWASAFNQTAHNGAPIQDGSFSIYVPAGAYKVAAHLPAGAPYMSGADKDVTVAAGEAATITLTLQKKNATIQGALWDPRNEVVVSGVDGVVGAWGGNNWAGTQINAGNGTYKFDVASGLWHLGYRIAPDSGYAKLITSKNVPVQAGQTVNVPLPVVPKDSAITGTVLAPNGDPLPGATVAVHAIGFPIKDMTFKTISAPDGSFRLNLPHGRYRLGALGGRPGWIKPGEKALAVGEGEVSGGHTLQFQLADAVISGQLTISGTTGLDGEANVWAWSEDGGFAHQRVPITDSVGMYALPVISNTVWHVGAAYDTSSQFWTAREVVAVGSGSLHITQDLDLTGPHPKPGPVVVTFDAAEPQRIVLADGTHIFIPAGAMPVTGEVTLRIVPIATLPHQQHANIYKYGYAFIATDSSGQPIEDNFNQDVIIGFKYEDAELVNLGILEGLLKPAYYSTTEEHWTFPESYAVDTDANIVTMQIDHFTDFALTAGEPEVVYLPLVMR